MNLWIKKTTALLYLVFFIVPVFSVEEAEFEFFPGEEFNLTEKQDLRKRINGRYQGFVYRETRASLNRDSWDEGGMEYSGYIYVFQEMKRNTRLIARRVEDSAPCDIHFSYRGEYRMDTEQVQPALRSVPTFPDEPVRPGDRWRAFGERIVRASDSSPYTKVPIFCEYEYRGVQGGVENPYHVISGQYAVRYRGEDSGGDRNLKQLDGSHRLDIRIPLDEPGNIFMRDTISEQYRMANGDLITYEGVILTWFDAPVEYDSHMVEEEVERVFGEIEGVEEQLEVEIRQEEEGLVLSIPNIHFVPDSAEILPDEALRLDGVAEILKTVPGLTYLVRGHTADVGSAESQLVLSEERALTIIGQMTARGIPENRFLYEGKGGTMPIGSNATEEGRKINRRVEIILLE